MPCYDSRDHKPQIEYQNGVDPSLVRKEKQRADKAEAMLCALMTELNQQNLAEKVMAQASRHGLIDLMAFWEKHQADDRARLAKELHKYSVDEQRVMFELIKASIGEHK